MQRQKKGAEILYMVYGRRQCIAVGYPGYTDRDEKQ